MKRTVWWALAVLAIMGMTVLEAGPARSASDLCPMGGVMVKTVIVKEKALDWAKNLPNVAIDGADTDDWTVLARSRTDQDIAMLIGPGYVFFGVAGRGGEVYPQDFDRAFGKDLGKLREAVKKDIMNSGRPASSRSRAATCRRFPMPSAVASSRKTAATGHSRPATVRQWIYPLPVSS